MHEGARSAVTIAVLCTLLLIGALWGWSEATKPLPGKAEAPTCVRQVIERGEKLYPDQVVVSVFNGSGRSGLAGSTSAQLAERGFVAGDVADSPQPAATTQIWSSDPTNPAVQLVQQQFKGAEVVPGNPIGVGVVVVVGEKFTALRKKQVESVVAEADATICKATGSE